MDEKAKKKRSKIDKSDFGSGFNLDPNEEKKKPATDKILNSNERLKENCAGEAVDEQICSIEGNITVMLNKEEKSHENKRKKKKGRKEVEVTNTNIVDDKGVKFLDDNHKSKMKKRKKYDYSLNEMQELGLSKPSKKKKMTEDNEIKNNEGEDADRGKQMKKKLCVESQHQEYNEFKSNEDKDDLDKKMKKEKKKKKKVNEESKAQEYNEFKSNEGEDDDQGKHMKKKKLGKERQHEEYNEFKSNEDKDDLDKKMKKEKKKKKKVNEESKVQEYNEFKSNEDLDDDQGKHMEKKLGKERQHEEYNEFKSNEDKVDQDQKMKKKEKKILSQERKSKEYNEFKSNEGEDDNQGKKMKEKKKLHDQSNSKENSKFNSNEGCVVTEVNDDRGEKMKKKKKVKEGISSKPKRVTFSDQVDVCCDGLVRGKWFTPEEDAKVKAAVFDYIESHGLGDDGLDMILHCKSHPEVRNCWKEITAALPDRPHMSVYYRAHILFERDEKRKWTPEELEFLRKAQEQHGSDWKSVADALGKHRFHVKDTWRRIKYANRNKGRWTQEEYQQLFDLVNQDLRLRASDGVYRKSKHGMLRDNIGWEAIGDKFTGRVSAVCCDKWYQQLTSPMVASGAWTDTDDYRLVSALYSLDACNMGEVDWDCLIEHRPGDVCRKRWNQMVRHIGESGGKPFAEQVEILAKRYCPQLLEARENFDAKPVTC